MEFPISLKMEDYYKKFIELQEKLRKSEEERLQLELRFNEMLRASKDDEQAYYRKLRCQYKRFLEEDRKRQDRNEKILRTLERIDARIATLSAKTERFNILRRQYHNYLQRITHEQPKQQHAKNPKQFDQVSKKTGAVVSEVGSPLNETKNKNILDKYIQDLSSRKCRDVLGINKQEYVREDKEFGANDANTIADDIMNSIYARYYSKDDMKFVSKPSLIVTHQKHEDIFQKNSEIIEETTRKEKKIEEKIKTEQPVKTNEETKEGDRYVVKTKIIIPQEQPNEDKSLILIKKPEEETPKTQQKTIILPTEEPKTQQICEEIEENFDQSHVQEFPHHQNQQYNEDNLQYQQYEENNDINVEETQHYDQNIKQIQPNEEHIEEHQQYVENNQQETQLDDEYAQPYEPCEEKMEENQQYEENVEETQQYDKNNQPVQQYEEDVQPVQQYEDVQPDQQYDENIQETQLYDENSQPYQQYEENVEGAQQYEENIQPVQQYEGITQPDQQYDENIQENQPYDEKTQSYQQYDENGQPLQQYQENVEETQQYEGIIQPNQQYQDTIQQYDETGQPIQQYQENVEQYDENGQPYQQYDENGQPYQQYDGNMDQYQQQYDENGQPLQYNDYQQYDQYGQPLYDVQYDENGQIIPQYDQNGQIYQQYDENGQQIQFEEPYNDPNQTIVENEEKTESGNSEDIKQDEINVEEAPKASTVMEMLDTDTESIKQIPSKASNDSDFDFSNN